MKKLLSCTLMAFVFLMMSNQAHAAWYKGTPKEVFVSSYTTGAIQVNPSISTNTAATAQYAPGAIYQVILSSGASSEFELLVDSANCTGITAGMLTSSLTAPATFLGPRLLYGSTTANTTVTFDPPLRFDTGLCIIDSAVTGQASITYELGRGISGQ